MAKKKLSDAEINQRQNAAVVHGGSGAARRVIEGKPLIGIARDAELAVYDELEAAGRAAIVTRNAGRLQAACDLYWGAVSMAAEAGDLVNLDKYISRFGWLVTASLRAWSQVRDETERPGQSVGVIDVLDAIREADNDK